MEIAAVVVLLIVAAACLPGRPRYRHWRGPECGTLEQVQREHLELFRTEADADGGDDE